jgi:hypothetical protein
VRKRSILGSKSYDRPHRPFYLLNSVHALLSPVITGAHTISTTVSCYLTTTNMDNSVDKSKAGFQKRKLPTQEDSQFELVFRKCLLRNSDGTSIILLQVFLVFPSTPGKCPENTLNQATTISLNIFPNDYSLSTAAFSAT